MSACWIGYTFRAWAYTCSLFILTVYKTTTNIICAIQVLNLSLVFKLKARLILHVSLQVILTKHISHGHSSFLIL